MVTVTVRGRDRILDVSVFCELVANGSKAGEDALYKSIAAATPEELAPFLLQRNENKQTALLYAAALGRVRLVRLLVQKGADHNARDADDGTTILMKENKCLDYFLQELDCSDIINAQDNQGWTALHWSNEYQYPDRLELLLKHGANPNVRDNDGETPLHCATSYGDTESVAVLLKYGASVKDVSDNGTTLLMFAAMYSREVLRYVLHELDFSDIMINAQDQTGWTALHWATQNLQDVELLLKYGANPNIQGNKGEAPLHVSAYNCNAQSAALLLLYGANLSLTDNMQRNTMHYAFVDGVVGPSTHFVQWLLDIGAEDLMLDKDQSGRTPLDEAFRHAESPEQQDIAILLLQQYAIKIVVQEGDLCLHWILRAAIYQKDNVTLPVGTLTIEQMLAFLLVLLTLMESAGLNLSSRGDVTGALPLHIACQNPNTPIQLIEFLVERDPSTVRQTDNSGNLPIHSMCTFRPSLHKVKYLLSRDAESATSLNSKGRAFRSGRTGISVCGSCLVSDES